MPTKKPESRRQAPKTKQQTPEEQARQAGVSLGKAFVEIAVLPRMGRHIATLIQFDGAVSGFYARLALSILAPEGTGEAYTRALVHFCEAFSAIAIEETTPENDGRLYPVTRQRARAIIRAVQIPPGELQRRANLYMEGRIANSANIWREYQLSEERGRVELNEDIHRIAYNTGTFSALENFLQATPEDENVTEKARKSLAWSQANHPDLHTRPETGQEYITCYRRGYMVAWEGILRGHVDANELAAKYQELAKALPE